MYVVQHRPIYTSTWQGHQLAVAAASEAAHAAKDQEFNQIMLAWESLMLINLAGRFEAPA